MNPRLNALNPYPFQRLNALLGEIQPAIEPVIAWSMGEPKHETAAFLIEALTNPVNIQQGLGTYPPTKGLPALRDAIADFVTQRFQLKDRPDPESQVLPVNGTREALFAFAQAVIDGSADTVTLMPNPFYQIYEGAALLAGSQPGFLNCTADSQFLPDLENVPESVWQACELIYICTPGNPTGAVMDIAALQQLIRLSDEHEFIIASDECYSELYFDETAPPPGLLQAASSMGRSDLKNCIAFNSLSKRSNLPGLRSGYVVGDASVIEKFLLYRTYHGSAMPVHHQLVSTLAWQDEQHVIDNRAVYRRKFEAVTRILADIWPMDIPEAGFYLWPETPLPDPEFATRLLTHTGVKVLPGSYLSRDTADGNPGINRVRMALVAPEAECITAAERIVAAWPQLSAHSATK